LAECFSQICKQHARLTTGTQPRVPLNSARTVQSYVKELGSEFATLLAGLRGGTVARPKGMYWTIISRFIDEDAKLVYTEDHGFW
jgi:hypothetical protein